MAKSRTRVKADKAESVGRKNLIINGGFDVWQRGTSITDAADGPYNYISADHWVTYYKGTYEKAENTLPNKQIVNAMKYTAGSTGNAPNFNTPIENGGKTLAGQTVTFSWWMKSSNPSTMKFRINSVGNGTYGSAQYNTSETPFSTHDATTEWTYHTSTKTLPDTLSYNHLNIDFWGDNADWASGDIFEFTHCQLELGSVATDFEHRSYGEELALCQRYYEVGSAYGNVSNSGKVRQGQSYVVTKRTTASITLFNNTRASVGADASETFFTLFNSGQTANYPYLTSYTADAEL